MAKPPKRTGNGNKAAPTGGRRNERSSGKSNDRPGGKAEYLASKTSKRGSFRKKEQDDRAKTPVKYYDHKGNYRPEREPRERPARPHFEDRPREPKSPRLKADLFGLHAVREAWKNEKRYVHALFITEAAMKEFEPDLKTSAKRPAPQIVTKDELDRAFPSGTVHQGIALSCQPLAENSVIDIIIKAETKKKSVVVILDQVTDPHNIGAILRSACAFGADGVVMQTRHAPEMDGILAKTACGALEHIQVAYETNLSRAIEKLKEHHYTVIGLDEHAGKTFGELHSYDRAVIVLGAEGPGMRRLIREHCDVLVTLPTKPPIASLNVSNAAAVALYALLS